MSTRDDLAKSYAELKRQRDSAKATLDDAEEASRKALDRSDLLRIRYENLNAAVGSVAKAMIELDAGDKPSTAARNAIAADS